ncbi:MAG: GAF domain-containing protein [Lachnospiraceae bacterium]|nr:GAF domain-containing protein [Lachnospiraceae bacterium]
MTDYSLLIKQAEALTEGVPYLTANLANISALIYESLDEVNWAGFYIMEEDKLVLGPFQGRPACVAIPMGKGVCGTAAEQDRTLVVANVHEFAGHIACDSASESEIVIPVHRGGKVWGVFDIDSPVRERFSEEDRQGLEELVKMLEQIIC